MKIRTNCGPLLPSSTQTNLTSTDILANATYVLNLDAIRDEHPPLLSFLSLRNQELIIAAVVTLSIIIGGMLFIDAALSEVASGVGEKAAEAANLAVRSLNVRTTFVMRSLNASSLVDNTAEENNEAVTEAKT